MIFYPLGPLAGFILFAHRNGPNAPGYSPNNGIFRIQSIAKKERQVVCKIIDIHTARQIVLYISEAISQCERRLSNRVCASLSYMISGYGDRIVVFYFMIIKILLNIPHHLERKFGRKYTCILCLILFKNICLHLSAYLGHCLLPDLLVGFFIQQFISGNS